MKRYLLSLTILTVGIAWIVVGAPAWGGQSLLQPAKPTPTVSAQPTASPDQDTAVKGVVEANDAIKTILTGHKEGSDYWVRIDYVDRWKTSKKDSNPVAMVNIYFDPPVSFSVDVPAESDPCSGHYGDDGYLTNPDDSCTSQTSVVSVVHRDFLNAQVIVVEVDLRSHAVVEAFQEGYSTDELKDVQGRYGR
jgi:hypothetical protein